MYDNSVMQDWAFDVCLSNLKASLQTESEGFMEISVSVGFTPQQTSVFTKFVEDIELHFYIVNYKTNLSVHPPTNRIKNEHSWSSPLTAQKNHWCESRVLD